MSLQFDESNVETKGEASLLRKLRRFMPAGPVDACLRKTFGLS